MRSPDADMPSSLTLSADESILVWRFSSAPQLCVSSLRLEKLASGTFKHSGLFTHLRALSALQIPDVAKLSPRFRHT